jgi:hypothetical protein
MTQCHVRSGNIRNAGFALLKNADVRHKFSRRSAHARKRPHRSMMDGEKGGEHHAHSTLARHRQPVDWHVAGNIAVGSRLHRSVRLDHWCAWAVRRSVCRGGIRHSVLPGEWGEILLGLALLVAPWTVGYETDWATISSMVSGILVILLGGSELMNDSDFATWWHDRWHHPAN